MFLSKSISQNTIGSILKEARQKNKWTLRQAERKTGIAQKYLEYLEADDFYKLPGTTYTRGFLERYAEFLKLNPEMIIERWRKDFSQVTKPEIPEKMGIKNKPHTFAEISVYFVIFAVLLFLVYLGFIIRNTLFTSSLEISSPAENMITQDSHLIIKGSADPGADIFINGQLLENVSADGTFQQEINLFPGLNIIEVAAQKKHAQKKIVSRQVILEK
jgi:transcriptional regulator with XRE-family HTH domain